MNPNDPEIKQIIAELIVSFEGALGMLAAAVAEQGDAKKLSDALARQISLFESIKGTPPLAIRLATSALGAVEEVRIQKAHQRNKDKD